MTTTTVHVEITEADVRAGQRSCAVSCPVALAIRRVLGREAEPTVSPSWLTYGPADGGGDRRAIRLPAEVGDLIARFDREGVMECFSFDLDLSRGEPS